MNITHALKWSFLSELATKAIQPVVLVVLARLLTPEDFGVMTAAMMVIAFSQIFWEAGMGKALIQRQTHLEEAANAAFMINIGLGVLIAGLLYQFAEPIAQTFFQDDRVTTVLQVMTLQVLLCAFGSVQTALLQKEMAFKKLFWVRFSTVSLPGFASIPLAWNGLGYWALVAGTLVGQFVQVLMLWRMSPWRPGKAQNITVMKEIAKFGGWVSATGLLTWFYAWADSMVVGYYLGSHDLGLFNAGSRISSIVYAVIFGPILPVLYSYLSRVAFDQEKLRKYAELVIECLTLIAVPTSIALFIFSRHIELVLFSDKWTGLGFVLAWMSIMNGYSWIVGMNGEFYRSLGKPFYETIVAAVALLVYLNIYLWVVHKGLELFVMSRALLALGTLFLHLVALRIILGVSIITITKKIAITTFISSVILFLSKEISINLFNLPFLQLSFGLVLAFLSIITALFFAKKSKIIDPLVYSIKEKRE